MSQIELKKLIDRLAKEENPHFSNDELKALYTLFSQGEENPIYEQWIKERWEAEFGATSQPEISMGSEIIGDNKKVSKIFGANRAILYRFYKATRDVAAILFISLLAGLLYLVMNTSNREGLTLLTENGNKELLVVERLESVAEQSQEFYSPAGTRSKIILEDSTTVWLASNSRLRVDKNYGQGSRRVSLVGQGYFDVKRAESIPFFVSVGDMTIKVKGTKFSVRAYNPTKLVETVLISGAVEIENKGKLTNLPPSYMATLANNSNQISLSKVKTEPYEAWKEGILIFEDAPMSKVIETLEETYNVRIEVKDDSIMNYILNGKLDNRSIAQIMEYISYTSPIKYTINKESIVISKK